MSVDTVMTNNNPSVAETIFSDERDIATIRTKIAQTAPDISEAEIQLFLAICRATRLDPRLNQIYAMQRKYQGKPRMTVQTGIDGFRAIAASTSQLGGIEDAIFDDESGVHPNKATVTVYRFVQGKRCAFTATARWSEYAQKDYGGNLSGLWRNMPFTMLAKCAEALALRKGFSDKLSGLYTHEEMSQADETMFEDLDALYRRTHHDQATSAPGGVTPTAAASSSTAVFASTPIPSPAPQETPKPEPKAKASPVRVKLASDKDRDTVLALLNGNPSMTAWLMPTYYPQYTKENRVSLNLTDEDAHSMMERWEAFNAEYERLHPAKPVEQPAEQPVEQPTREVAEEVAKEAAPSNIMPFPTAPATSTTSATSATTSVIPDETPEEKRNRLSAAYAVAITRIRDAGMSHVEMITAILNKKVRTWGRGEKPLNIFTDEQLEQAIALANRYDVQRSPEENAVVLAPELVEQVAQ